jgi:hypothetical protein
MQHHLLQTVHQLQQQLAEIKADQYRHHRHTCRPLPPHHSHRSSHFSSDHSPSPPLPPRRSMSYKSHSPHGFSSSHSLSGGHGPSLHHHCFDSLQSPRSPQSFTDDGSSSSYSSSEQRQFLSTPRAIDRHPCRSDSPHTVHTAPLPRSPKRPSKLSDRGQEEGKPKKRRTHHTVSARSLIRLTGDRATRLTWRLRAELPFAVAALLVPPLLIPNVSNDVVPLDPSTSDEKFDPFTRSLWEAHKQQIATGALNQLYTMRNLIPDSFYIHVVKELHQPGHLERCGLQQTNLTLYNSLRNKRDRDVRFMLFDTESSAMPVLVSVNREAVTLPTPEYNKCKRVIPISQVRRVMERLHDVKNHSIMGIEKRVSEDYIGIPREWARRYAKHCG